MVKRSDLDKPDLPERIRRELRRFIGRVREQLSGDCEVYLFGSYARGDWVSDSDLDLIVVSSRFDGLELGRRHLLVRELLPSWLSVELLLYTPKEFEMAKKRSIIEDAAEYWIKLV